MAGKDNLSQETVNTVSIPFIHPKLDLSYLNANGKLYTDAQIQAVSKNPEIQAAEGRITKKQLNEIFKTDIAKGTLTEFEFSLQRAGASYEIIYKGKKSSLGAGSFGSVKLLQNMTTGETTEVIKVIKALDVTPKEIEEEKFGLEKAGQLHAIHKRPDKKNQYEIVMDLAKGSTLQHFEQRTKGMTTVMWVDMILSVLNAVKDFHANSGLLHCDLKPENIYYNPITKETTLVDMGLVAFTSDIIKGVNSYPRGTPPFMSKENWDGKNNERTEIYALAMTLGNVLNLADFTPQWIEAMEQEVEVLEIRENDNNTNNKIPDENTRKAVLKILQTMANPVNNYSLTNAAGHTNLIEQVSKIREEYLDALGLTNQVTYLDVETYLSATPDEKATMLKALSNVDEVWLVDNNGANQKSYLSVQHDLMAADIGVSQSVIQYQGNNLDDVLNQYAAQRERADRNIYECSVITKTGQLASLSQDLTTMQVKKIVDSLQNEKSSQQELIKQAVQSIQTNKSIANAFRVLDNLQTNMLAEKQSQNNIIKLMQDIEKSIIKPQKLSADAKGFDAVIKSRESAPQARVAAPPPLPRAVSDILRNVTKTPPPTLPRSDNFFAKKPSAIPAHLKAEFDTLKSPATPEFKAWSEQKKDYTNLLAISVEAMQKSLNRQNNNRFKTFANEDVVKATTFYLNLMESATTLFQKAVILHSLLANPEKKYGELGYNIIARISTQFEPNKEKALFESVKKLDPKNVEMFLASLNNISASKDPALFKDKVIQQLKQLDPTPENVREAVNDKVIKKS